MGLNNVELIPCNLHNRCQDAIDNRTLDRLESDSLPQLSIGSEMGASDDLGWNRFLKVLEENSSLSALLVSNPMTIHRVPDFDCY